MLDGPYTHEFCIGPAGTKAIGICAIDQLPGGLTGLAARQASLYQRVYEWTGEFAFRRATLGVANVRSGVTGDPLLDELRTYVGQRFGPVHAWDPVNHPMMRHWHEALGFPAGIDAVPATMLPVWLMPGLTGGVPAGSDARDHRAIMKVLEREGYHGILGTNCEQEYERPLQIGERISATYEVETVSDRKHTKFGPGYFISFLQTFHDEAGLPVGRMRLRIVRFKPAAVTAEQPAPPQPSMSQDTSFFWEGLRRQTLLIQRCAQCGLLRHPPGPACEVCHALDWDAVTASGCGELYSFVLVHTPQYAAFDYPHPVGLIALDEGVRLIAPLAPADRDQLKIGDRMQAVLHAFDGTDRLPVFHRVAGA